MIRTRNATNLIKIIIIADNYLFNFIIIADRADLIITFFRNVILIYWKHLSFIVLSTRFISNLKVFIGNKLKSGLV